MLKKEYIKEQVLKKKLSVQDRYFIHEKIKERYYNLSKWNTADSYGKLLAVELDKLIKLYIKHINPALYEIYQKHPSICKTLKGIVISGFINLDKLASIYTEEKSKNYSKAVIPINITVEFSKILGEEPPIINDRFGSLSDFIVLNDWIISNIDKVPEVRSIITKIRTLQNKILEINYRRVNDKISDLYNVGSGGNLYAYSIDFKNRKDLLTVEDLFDFDPELFISYCRSKGIMGYLKNWKKPTTAVKDGDSLECLIEKLKKIL